LSPANRIDPDHSALVSSRGVVPIGMAIDRRGLLGTMRFVKIMFLLLMAATTGWAGGARPRARARP